MAPNPLNKFRQHHGRSFGQDSRFDSGPKEKRKTARGRRAPRTRDLGTLFFLWLLATSLGSADTFAQGASSQASNKPPAELRFQVVALEENTELGQPVEVEVWASRPQASPHSVLGTFDVSLTFPPELLDLEKLAYGDVLGQVDKGAAHFVHHEQDDKVTVVGLSLSSAQELEERQPRHLKLFSVLFRSMAPGVGQVNLEIEALGGATGRVLENGGVTPSRVEILGDELAAAVDVPISGTGLALMTAAMLSAALLVLRRSA